MIDFQRVADAIEKASPDIKNLMFSEDTAKKVEEIAGNNNLDEETTLRLVDEVGYVILNLSQKNSFADNLVKIGIEKVKAEKIFREVDRSVFVELNKISKSINQQPVQQPQSTVGNSFETIILNQAKAMRPALAPNNLPGAEVREEKPRVIHNYIAKTDPYREPAE